MRFEGMLLIAGGLAACSSKPQSPAGQDPRAVLQAYVDAWNRHDSLALDTLLAPTGIHEDLAWGFRGEGPAAVRGFMRDVIAVSPDFQWGVTASFTDGQRVVAEWTWTATFTGPSPSGPVTNQLVAGRGVAVAQIAKGKIIRLSDYYDAASFFPKQTPDMAHRRGSAQ
jgi:steroid delta-isomerase-like uncharacterized protein